MKSFKLQLLKMLKQLTKKVVAIGFLLSRAVTGNHDIVTSFGSTTSYYDVTSSTMAVESST